MNKLVLVSVAVLLGVSVSSVRADEHPCKPKKEAKHAAHKALHECLEAWSKDHKPTDTDPTDDCSSKTAAFVQAAKDLKACHVEHHKK